ncbi:MAG TPA: aromatic amino acid transport family protein [Candidatus Nanoarchaeia archaeon]|nr:aromatic amino acid transport family protein [Candidatus Nanoarchaeia archaeon]
MKAPRAYYEAIATLTGCIIGAGILGIPYVLVRAGFWTGMLVIIVLGLAMLLVHLLIGEISLRSTKCHQLVGYAEKYLGRPGKYFMAASMVIGIYGAMIAYTLGVSESLSAVFGGAQWFWAFAFYLLMSLLLYGGLQILEKSELLMETFKLSIFAIILAVLFSSRYFSAEKLVGFSWYNLLIPYGVVLFAYVGTAAIPEVRQEMNKCKLLTKRAIIIGSVIPIVAYALFAFAVVGVSGVNTSEVATIGLAFLVGGFGFILLHLFAVLAMASSFVALGYALKDSYRFDFGISHSWAWLLTLIVPALLLFAGVDSFVRTLEIAGIFAGGIAGIVIVLTHSKAKRMSDRKPEYSIKINWLGYGALIALFSIGILYGLFMLF